MRRAYERIFQRKTPEKGVNGQKNVRSLPEGWDFRGEKRFSLANRSILWYTVLKFEVYINFTERYK